MNNSSITKSTGFNFNNFISLAALVILGLTLASCSIFDDDEEHEEYEWIGKWKIGEVEDVIFYNHIKSNEITRYVYSTEGCYTVTVMVITDKESNVIRGYTIEDNEVELMLEVSNGTLTMTILEYKSNGESIDREIGRQFEYESMDSFPFDAEECEEGF